MLAIDPRATATTRAGDPEATISVLKDFMQTGRFSRGPLEFSSQTSIVLGGNIDTDTARELPIDRYSQLFEALPTERETDTAFLDQMHAFLPGWELPKIRSENYAQGYGFITDYLAEIFALFRRETHFSIAVQSRAKFDGLTGRNQTAISKTAAGLLKLIYPHRTADDLRREEPERIGVEESASHRCGTRVTWRPRTTAGGRRHRGLRPPYWQTTAAIR